MKNAAAGLALAFALASEAGAQWIDLVRNNVTNTFGHGARAIPYDFDRDGDRDLVCSYTLADAVYLALNVGGTGTSWQLELVATESPAPNALPIDADCDGDRDIVALAFIDRNLGFESPGQVSWFERPAALGAGPWTEWLIDGTLIHVFTLDVADADGDTDEDILVATTSQTVPNVVVWYENRCGEAGPRWQRWTIATGPEFTAAGSARWAHVDGDAFIDVVAADRDGHRVRWFGSDGVPRKHAWVGRDVVADAANYAAPDAVRPYDMDGDGDQDVLVPFRDSSRVDWFENPGGAAAGPWTPHPVTGDLPAAHDVVRDDFDNDGLPDIAAISPQSDRGGTDTLVVFTNNGDGTYTRHMPDGNYFGANYIDSGDIDGDGDADVTTGSYLGDSIDWWRNDHPLRPPPTPREASPGGGMLATKGPGGSIAVSYAPACGATNHAIYWDRGPLAIGADWSGVSCNRGTSGLASFHPGTLPPNGLVYFVIVGQNATQEGSYGRTSSGAERSDGVAFGACDRPLVIGGSCP